MNSAACSRSMRSSLTGPNRVMSRRGKPTRAGRGGVCIDPGVHSSILELDIRPGQFESGSLSRTFWPIAVEDHASVASTVGDGAIASVVLSISSWQSRFEITAELEGAQLMLRGRGKFYGPQRLTQAAKWPWLHPEQPREQTWDYGSDDGSFAAETADFVSWRRRRGRRRRLANAADAVAVMQSSTAAMSFPSERPR